MESGATTAEILAISPAIAVIAASLALGLALGPEFVRN
jgi:hypothetical protein